MWKNNRGLSLVEVLMSMAILTIVVLGVMELNRGNANSSVNSSSNLDYVQLVAEFLTIIEDDDHCQSSLADPQSIAAGGGLNATGSQVSFRASMIRNGSLEANHIPIEIWSGDKNDNNVRVNRRLFATQQYGNITIDSITLHLPDHTGVDFGAPQYIQAEIVVKGRKRISTDDDREIKPITKTIQINTDIDPMTGNSVVTRCTI